MFKLEHLLMRLSEALWVDDHSVDLFIYVTLIFNVTLSYEILGQGPRLRNI